MRVTPVDPISPSDLSDVGPEELTLVYDIVEKMVEGGYLEAARDVLEVLVKLNPQEPKLRIRLDELCSALS